MKSFFSKNNLIFWVLILIPVLLVFRNIFFGNLPTWGDAPFFYPEGLKELFSEPLTWVTRNTSFGGVNSVLWISPIMFLMGAVHRFFGLGSDALVRIFFYFPAIIFSGAGAYWLVRYLKLSRLVCFFAPLFYILNTYFILLLDGGQVGIALAYGFFPLVILFGKKLLDKSSLNKFFVFLTAAFVLTVIDPRISIIALITLFFWQTLDAPKKLWLLILAGVLLIPLNFYWIYPLIKLGAGSAGANIADLRLSSLLNSLLLYAPHWPGNIFGKVIPPPFYFALVPFLIFGSFLFKPKSKLYLNLVVLFLTFAFLAKGSTPPLGGWFDFLVNKVPFGFAFRDSTKFFIPLVLFGGILLGGTISQLKSWVLRVGCYLFLLLLILPAFLGKMNFVLSGREVNADFQIIYQNLRNETGFFRTVWFPEKHSLAFETSAKPAIDARELVSLAPFANLNASEDVFNFLNNPAFVEWLRIFGVKYLVLSGDARNINPTEDEVKDWRTILSLVGKTPGLQKVAWGTEFPVYEIPDSFPRFYAVKSLAAVVGPMLKDPVVAVYFEDGKFDPELLNGKDENSVKIYFNGKDKTDLTLSFLQKYFVSPGESPASQWAIYPSADYLKAKYELLIRGFGYRDFDYGQGIAFSTQRGEKIAFKFEVPADGKYYLASRQATLAKPNFSWTLEQKDFNKGTFTWGVENQADLTVFNTIALIPAAEFKKAQDQTEVFLKHFGTASLKDLQKVDRQPVDLAAIKSGWLVLNDNFNPLWNLKKGVEYFTPVPVYSSVNGFYVGPDWTDLRLEFRGQEYFRWGVWGSVLTILALAIFFLYARDNH